MYQRKLSCQQHHAYIIEACVPLDESLSRDSSHPAEVDPRVVADWVARPSSSDTLFFSFSPLWIPSMTKPWLLPLSFLPPTCVSPLRFSPNSRGCPVRKHFLTEWVRLCMDTPADIPPKALILCVFAPIIVSVHASLARNTSSSHREHPVRCCSLGRPLRPSSSLGALSRDYQSRPT